MSDNFIQKLWSSRVNTVDGTQFVGDSNRLWYDSITNTIRVHNGEPGGKLVASGGASGSGFTGSQGTTGFTGSTGAGFAGSQGTAGFTGSQGTAGQSVAAGGTEFQLLEKASSTDFDTRWTDIATVKGLQLDTVDPADPATGRIIWNDGDEVPQFVSNGVTVDLGLELLARCRNVTGSAIPKGTAVCIVGASATRISIAPSDRTQPGSACRTLGLTLEEIETDNFGKVSTFGLVRGLDTESIDGDEGDELFVGATPGTLTTTPPDAPARRLSVGYLVTKNPNQGRIFVSIRRGVKVDEIDNVQITDIADGDVIRYNGTAGRFENVQLDKDAVGLSSVQNVDQTNADNLTSGTVSSARIDGNYTGISRTAAVFSHPTDTESVSTTHQRALVASQNSRASGISSAVIASNEGNAGGVRTAIIASLRSTANVFGSSVVSSDDSRVEGFRAAVVCSQRTQNNFDFSLALGWATSGDVSTANRTIHFFGNNGNARLAGSLTQSANFTDFAELMPNATGAEIAAGTLLTLEDGAVRPANQGEEICGVVSHTAAILAGDTPFSWQGRYLHDEFGRRLYEDIADPDWQAEIADPDWNGQGEQPMIANSEPQRTISVLKENPNWNPELPQVPRSERPDEWTPVGLIGQVYVRLGEQVQPGDRISANDGKGYATDERTGLKVMQVTKDYDGEYGIARCLLNVMV